MTKLKAQLEAAQRELAELREDLPRFHGLLTDNEQEVERLRREKAELGEQAQARGKVNIARELLEQHQADILSAQGEVERLKAEVEHAAIIEKMAVAAADATRYRQEIEVVLKAGSVALKKHVLKLHEADKAFTEARNTFLNTGGQFSRLFSARWSPQNWSYERLQQERQLSEGILEEVRALGVDISDVLTRHGVAGRESDLDLQHPERIDVPTPFGHTLYNAMSQHRGLIYQERLKDERERKTAELAEAARQERLNGPVEIRMNPSDEGAAIDALGELIKNLRRHRNGLVGEPDHLSIYVSPEDVEQADELLKGRAGYAYEVIPNV